MWGQRRQHSEDPQSSLHCKCKASQDNTEEFVKKHGGENVQRQLAQLYSQYKLMEANMNRQKLGLKTKLPDI